MSVKMVVKEYVVQYLSDFRHPITTDVGIVFIVRDKNIKQLPGLKQLFNFLSFIILDKPFCDLPFLSPVLPMPM